MDVTLTMEQVDDPPPECPRCASATRQEFKPVAIGGSITAKANQLAETIAHEDYGVADMQRDYHEKSTPKVRYKDQGTPSQAAAASSWGAPGGLMQQAIAIGRQTRMDPKSGGMNGVDMLQHMIKTGEQPDLIANSKKLSAKIW